MRVSLRRGCGLGGVGESDVGGGYVEGNGRTLDKSCSYSNDELIPRKLCVYVR